MNTINQESAGKSVLQRLLGCAVLTLALSAGTAYAQVDTNPGTCSPNPMADGTRSLAAGCRAEADTEDSVVVGDEARTRAYQGENQPLRESVEYRLTLGTGAFMQTIGGVDYSTERTVYARRVNGVLEVDAENQPILYRTAMGAQNGDMNARINGYRNPGSGSPSPATVYTLTVEGTVQRAASDTLGGQEVAIGRSASVTGEQSVAIGRQARVGSPPSGGGVQPNANAAERSVAIGAGASVNGGSHDSVAIGQGASVTGANGVAIGQGAGAAANSIAIGRGVTAAADQIRIGGAAQTDVRIGRYELGTMDTRITTNADGVRANAAGLRTNAARINDNADDIETNRAGVAMALSLGALPQFREGNSWGIAASTFESETAIAFGANFDLGANRVVRVGVSSAGGETSGAVGFGMKF